MEQIKTEWQSNHTDHFFTAPLAARSSCAAASVQPGSCAGGVCGVEAGWGHPVVGPWDGRIAERGETLTVTARSSFFSQLRCKKQDWRKVWRSCLKTVHQSFLFVPGKQNNQAPYALNHRALSKITSIGCLVSCWKLKVATNKSESGLGSYSKPSYDYFFQISESNFAEKLLPFNSNYCQFQPVPNTNRLASGIF